MENVIEAQTVEILKISDEIDEKYFTLWKAKKSIEKEMDELKEKIVSGLKERNAAGKHLQAVWVEPSTVFDSAKLKQAMPEIYAGFLKPKAGYYTLKVSEKGGQ